MPLDAHEFIVPVGPPQEAPPEVKRAAEIQGAFRYGSSQPPQAIPASSRMPRDSGQVDAPPGARSAVCVLNDRGSHIHIGAACPHGLLTLDHESVTRVEF